MCGICGLVSFNGYSRNLERVCAMLTLLRHRGYDSWGIANYSPGTTKIRTQRYTGSVPASPDPVTYEKDKDEAGISFYIGHTRYTTRGSHECHSQAQPLMSRDGAIALVHNGQVECDQSIHGSDTEYLLETLEDCLASEDTLESAFQQLFITLDGAYACIAVVENLGLLAFRDPWGTRPLCIGTTDNGDIMIASESCAFPDIHPDDFFNVEPGEVVLITGNGDVRLIEPLIEREEEKFPASPCLFEFIYLAHDDSVIDGISVKQAREEMGKMMAPLVKDLDIDLVIPVPHTPVLAGKVLAKTLGTGYVDLLKVHSRQARRENRTFILPTQTAREQAVKQKFAVKSQEIAKCRGKNLLVLDDSIVRGTTLKHVVKLIKTAVKPAKIYVASLSPAVISPNRFGIAIPTKDKLIAHSPTASDSAAISKMVASRLEVDGGVIYQSLETLEKGLKSLCNGVLVEGFKNSVFRHNK